MATSTSLDTPRDAAAPPLTLAARLRALLELPADVDDDGIVTMVHNRLTLVNAALDVGFSETFNRAVALGRAAESERDDWRALFRDSPDAVRAALEADHGRQC